MTDAQESAVLELLKLNRKEQRERDSSFKELLEKTHSEIASTRGDVQALSQRLELHEKDDTHTHGILDKRLEYLEDRAEATGQHEIVQLRTELDERKATSKEWRGRAASVLITFFTTAIIGLVGYYLSTR